MTPEELLDFGALLEFVREDLEEATARAQTVDEISRVQRVARKNFSALGKIFGRLARGEKVVVKIKEAPK